MAPPQTWASIGKIKVDPGPNPRPIAIALQPARTIVGRVTLCRHRPARPPCPGRVGPIVFRGRRRGAIPRPRGPGGRRSLRGPSPVPRRCTVPDGLQAG